MQKASSDVFLHDKIKSITDYGSNDVIVNNTLVDADAPAVMPAVPVAP